jgi:16S rRNA (cytidine1402-2'-O)-methyltransferase
MTEDSPALYVVATPLGHLGDMTLRAIEVLRQVPWVAAEDTRHSAPLLRHYGCNARLLAAHQHNEESAAATGHGAPCGRRVGGSGGRRRHAG